MMIISFALNDIIDDDDISKIRNFNFANIHVEMTFVIITLTILILSIANEIFCCCCGCCCCQSNDDDDDNDDKNNNNRPEQQIQYMLCMSENAIHDYLLILRVGCPTVDFDLNNSCIDFEILGHNDQIIGNAIRFDCSRFRDLVCSEMHCILKRLTPMPKIYGIRASHSNRQSHRQSPIALSSSITSTTSTKKSTTTTTTIKSSAIFFYEYELHDRTNNNKIIDFQLILDYIERQPRVFRGFVPKKKHNNMDNNMIGLYPEIPIMELSTLEISILSCFTMTLNGTLCMLFESANLYLYARQEWHGSLYRSLQDWLFISPIVLLLLLMNIYLYKYQIKRLAVRYQYSVRQTNTNISLMRYCAKSYLILMVKLIIAFDAIIIYFSMRKSSLSHTFSWYWISSTILTSCTVLSIWSCLNRCTICRQYYNNRSSSASWILNSTTKVDMLPSSMDNVNNKTKAKKPQLIK